MILAVTLTGCSVNQAKLPQPTDGVLDLRQWDLLAHDVIKLDGTWEFYWKQFLGYRDLQGEKPDLFATVPETWNEYSIDGKRLPGSGYATYRLRIKTALPVGTQLGLRLYAFSSAYDLFINDKLVASNGRVATNASREIGEYKPQAVLFHTPAKEFDIVLHVSNFQYAKGGFWYSATLGSGDKILDLHDLLMIKEALLIGALIITSLFHLAIYALRKEFRYSLYFSCLCLLIALSLDMVGQFMLPRVISGMPFQAVIFTWYTSTTWVIFFLILYFHELFASTFSTLLMRSYFAVCVLLQMLYLFTPTTFYSRFADVSNYTDIAAILGVIVVAAIGSVKGGRDGLLHVLSLSIVAAAYIHDILFWTNRIHSDTGELIYAGIFLTIFLQMVVQARRIKLSYDEKAAAELSFLQSQIKPHFLFNTLNTFISISYYDMAKARTLLYSFSNYLRRSFDFRDPSELVPLQDEIELAKVYTAVEKARFEERLEVDFQVSDAPDVKVPRLVLQPVIENAIIHGVLPCEEGGRVDVLIELKDEILAFKVTDNGIGMDAEKVADILSRGAAKGVGLCNIDKRLRKLYGKGLSINSRPGRGTEVAWSIPVGSRRKWLDQSSARGR
jgi:signal transduction histidine kinase